MCLWILYSLAQRGKQAILLHKETVRAKHNVTVLVKLQAVRGYHPCSSETKWTQGCLASSYCREMLWWNSIPVLKLTWIPCLRRPDSARWADFMYFCNFSNFHLVLGLWTWNSDKSFPIRQVSLVYAFWYLFTLFADSLSHLVWASLKSKNYFQSYTSFTFRRETLKFLKIPGNNTLVGVELWIKVLCSSLKGQPVPDRKVFNAALSLNGF